MTTGLAAKTTPTRTPGEDFGPRPRARVSTASETRGGLLLMAPYVVLLLVAGVIPVAYAIKTSLERAPTPVDPSSGFGGLDSFKTAVQDYRFVDTFVNILGTLVI